MTIAQGLTNLLKTEYISNRALPNSPDGSYEPVQQDPGAIVSLWNRFYTQTKRGVPLPSNPRAVTAFLQTIYATTTGTGIDDRLHGLEDGLDILSHLDPSSPLAAALNKAAVTGLYNTLPHPPMNFVGNSRFREADGGFNNPHLPNLGRAGQPYARNAQAHTPLPPADLPEPGLVFDVLLERRDDPQHNNNHPNGNSSLTFAFASLVTHSIFRTNLRDMNINDVSSYLDLSPLYGSSKDEQNTIRIKDGRGRIYPDSFVEDRLVLLPPACSALLLIFSRNHNYTADMLLKINEQKQWKDPSTFKADDPRLFKQDEEIFQTAKLINAGHFMAMISSDYVAGFFGCTRNGGSYHMQPFNKIIRPDGGEVIRGQGNQGSVEFNLLYRWHSTLSYKDEKWTGEMLNGILKRDDWENITIEDFVTAARAGLFPTDPPQHRDLFPGHGIKRQEDGRYRDEDIAKILQDATNDPAHRYGARTTPSCLRVIEMLTIQQGRQWGVCTMNEFRVAMGLKPYSSFEEWNSNKEIANAARSLYQHIDRLELYPGLQAEETMKMTYGTGFCTGYTVMRAILCDAIALVRGDRFFTTDFTPKNLTAWGFNDVEPIQDNGAWGACLPKLLLRHLPSNYTYNSVYGLFPFFTPQAMKTNLQKLKIADKYDFAEPKSLQPPAIVETLQGIRSVFYDPERFKVVYGNDMRYLTDGYGFFLVFEDKARHDADKLMALSALWEGGDIKGFCKWYTATTKQLLSENSYSYDVAATSSYRKSQYVDIVRKVINPLGIRWAAEHITGMSLKTKQNPHGMFTEQEAYMMVVANFMCVFENVAPEHGWFLRTKAKQVSDVMNQVIAHSIEQVRPKHPISAFIAKVSTLVTTGAHDLVDNRPCYGFLRRLSASGRPMVDLVATAAGLATGSSVNFSQACSQVIDFYLDDARQKEREDIVKLVQTPEDDEAANQRLIGYIKEGQRLAPQFPGLLRVCAARTPVTVKQGNGKPDVVVQPGQAVFGSYYNAQTDPNDFPDPLTVNPERNRDKYAVQGIGFHGCPGVQFAERTFLAIFRVIFSLKNLRRAPGVQGELASFPDNQVGTEWRSFLDDKGAVFPWPGQLIVAYDVD